MSGQQRSQVNRTEIAPQPKASAGAYISSALSMKSHTCHSNTEACLRNLPPAWPSLAIPSVIPCLHVEKLGDPSGHNGLITSSGLSF